MQRAFLVILTSLLFWLTPLVAQQAGSAESEPEAQQEGAGTPQTEPTPAPRVVGEARTPEEWDAWQAITRAPSLAEKAELSRRFLENFPDSGLTANAHYFIAQYLYQTGDVESFVRHAEIALEELPNAVDLLGELAFFYAEQDQPEKAIDRANRALDLLQATNKPVGVTPEAWVDQVYKLRAEANYALGRAYLSRMPSENRSESPALSRAVNHLEAALKFDPRHDYAAFRLGFAERNANDAGGALMAYGRAAALGGVAAGPARNQVEDVLGIVKEALPDSEWAEMSADEVVNRAAAQMQEDLTALQQEKQQMVENIREQELLQEPLFPPPSSSGPADPGTAGAGEETPG